MAMGLPEPMDCVKKDAKIGKKSRKERDLKDRKMDGRRSAGRGAEQEAALALRGSCFYFA